MCKSILIFHWNYVSRTVSDNTEILVKNHDFFIPLAFDAAFGVKLLCVHGYLLSTRNLKHLHCTVIEIFDAENIVTLTYELEVMKGHEKSTTGNRVYGFILDFHGKYTCMYGRIFNSFSSIHEREAAGQNRTNGVGQSILHSCNRAKKFKNQIWRWCSDPFFIYSASASAHLATLARHRLTSKPVPGKSHTGNILRLYGLQFRDKYKYAS